MRRSLPVVVLAILSAVVGLASGTTLAAFSDSTSNTGNVFTANATFCTPGSQTVSTANADSYVNQAVPTENKGTDSNLFVQSKSGSQNRRTVVRFTMPTIPAGCSVTSATLSVYNKSPTSGRTIQALRATSTWTETGVNWNNQPTTDGTAIATSTTPSSGAYQQWTVTTQVQAIYAGTNNGFLLKDATENSASSPSQNYSAREDSPNDPTLAVSWA